MFVKDVMTPDPVTIQADASVSEAASILRKKRIGGIPIMKGEILVGIVTETDLLSLLDVGELSDDLWLPSPLEIIEIPIREFVNWEKTRKALTDISESPVSDIMSTDVICIDEEAEIEEAAKLMLSEGIARLPVVRENRLIGIITRQDIVRGIGTSFPDEDEE